MVKSSPGDANVSSRTHRQSGFKLPLAMLRRSGRKDGFTNARLFPEIDVSTDSKSLKK
jgi:hypothetical protein